MLAVASVLDTLVLREALVVANELLTTAKEAEAAVKVEAVDSKLVSLVETELE